MDPREQATAAALADVAGFGQYRKTATTRARQMAVPFKTETHGNTVEGKAGDYLCIDSAGVPYPCDKDVFETSYVPADAPESY